MSPFVKDIEVTIIDHKISTTISNSVRINMQALLRQKIRGRRIIVASYCSRFRSRSYHEILLSYEDMIIREARRSRDGVKCITLFKAFSFNSLGFSYWWARGRRLVRWTNQNTFLHNTFLKRLLPPLDRHSFRNHSYLMSEQSLQQLSAG